MSFIQNYMVEPKLFAEIELKKEKTAYSLTMNLTNGKSFFIDKTRSKKNFYSDFKSLISEVYEKPIYVYKFLETLNSDEHKEHFKSTENHKMPKEVQLFL